MIGVLPVGLIIETAPPGMVHVINAEAAEGMASSIRTGTRALDNFLPISGAVILACDQPAVTAGHLRELANDRGNILASAYAGRRGIPAYFPRSAFETLLTLHGDQGARHLLEHASTIPLHHGELDIDTVEDLEEARKLYSG